MKQVKNQWSSSLMLDQGRAGMELMATHPCGLVRMDSSINWSKTPRMFPIRLLECSSRIDFH